MFIVKLDKQVNILFRESPYQVFFRLIKKATNWFCWLSGNLKLAPMSALLKVLQAV